MSEANPSGIKDLLSIPIVIRLTCDLYKKNKALPRKREPNWHKLIEEVIYKTIETTLKKSRKEFSKERIDALLAKLGKLSWEALQKPSEQQFIEKVKK